MFSVTMNMKTKMALTLSALFFVVFSVFALITLTYFQGQLKKTIADQQFQTVSIAAADINDEVVAAETALGELARILSIRSVDNPVYLQKTLDRTVAQEFLLDTYFNDGIFIFSPAGALLAESPLHRNRIGAVYRDHEIFRRDLRAAVPAVSQPYITRCTPHEPVVAVTVPLTGPDGKIHALLGGRIALTRHNFMSHVVSVKIGETGYLYLFDGNKTTILHRDTSKIMRRGGDSRTGAFMNRAVSGFEGSLEVINSKNILMLASVKRMRKTGWYLAAYYPTREAYAPLYAAKKFSLALLAAGLGLTTLLTWLFMKKHLSPLIRLSGQVRTIGGDVLHSEPVDVPRTGDEVAMLGQAFNEMQQRIKDWGGLVQETNERLAGMNEFNRSLIDGSLDMIIAVDRDRAIVEFNKAAERTFGYQRDEVIGKHVGILYGDPATGTRVGGQTRENGRFLGEIVNRRKNGEAFPAYLSAACLYDSSGEIAGVMGISRDITDQKRAEEELRQAYELLKQRASIDALTGIYNRYSFDEMLETEIDRAQRYKTPLSLIMFDLDHFKRINDTYGHQTGDRVLKDLAQRVCSNLRLHDVFARWGGEEFMILVPNNDREQARQLAEKLRDLVRGSFESGVALTCSFGIAELGADDTYETLTRRADIALYRAKEKGRDRVEAED